MILRYVTDPKRFGYFYTPRVHDERSLSVKSFLLYGSWLRLYFVLYYSWDTLRSFLYFVSIPDKYQLRSNPSLFRRPFCTWKKSTANYQFVLNRMSPSWTPTPCPRYVLLVPFARHDYLSSPRADVIFLIFSPLLFRPIPV